MADPAIDYWALYFPHKNLTLIHNEPTYQTLTQMWKEHKANTASVKSTLGGTNNHHFLILSPARYNLIFLTLFICSAHLGQLIIPQRAMVHQATVLTNEHKEQLWTYR